MQQALCEEAVGISLRWYVAHTRPRREKKLAAYCEREGFDVTLPCLASRKKYRRKTVEFEKPLFPGYLFFRSEPERVQRVYQNEHTANVLSVFDQETFDCQLQEIISALKNDCLVVGTVQLCAGAKVRIVTGPLAGMVGRVLTLATQTAVVLNLDFIGQGAAVVVDRDWVEAID